MCGDRQTVQIHALLNTHLCKQPAWWIDAIAAHGQEMSDP